MIPIETGDVDLWLKGTVEEAKKLLEVGTGGSVRSKRGAVELEARLTRDLPGLRKHLDARRARRPLHRLSWPEFRQHGERRAAGDRLQNVGHAN